LKGQLLKNKFTGLFSIFTIIYILHRSDFCLHWV